MLAYGESPSPRSLGVGSVGYCQGEQALAGVVALSVRLALGIIGAGGQRL